jgi:hypothetical protein
MGSLSERLDERMQAGQAQAEQIRGQVAALTARLGEVEADLERLRVARTVFDELLAAGVIDDPVAADPDGPVAVEPASGGRWPQAVPPWVPGLDTSRMPQVYRDVLEVMDDVGEPVTSRHLCKATGGGTEPRHTEAMRGKLNRLVERGWCVSPEPGRYTLAPGVRGRTG